MGKTHQMGGHPPIVSILNMKEGNKYTIFMGLYERGGQGIFNLYCRNKVKLCERGGGGDDLSKHLVLVWWDLWELELGMIKLSSSKVC